MEALKSDLVSFTKLDRDRALQDLEAAVGGGNNVFSISETDLRDLERYLLENVVENTEEKSWETLHGSLDGLKILTLKRRISSELVPKIESVCLNLLNHDEVRVRLASGELLGALCYYAGPSIYENCRDTVLNLISSNLDRVFAGSDVEKNDKLVRKLVRSHSFDSDGGIEAEKIFHDTAGWRSLETSMKCLEWMVEGCGENFQPFITENLIELIFKTLPHQNRFVRETGFYLLGALVSCRKINLQTGNGNGTQDFGDPIGKFAIKIAENLASGLADNWSQVRLGSSTATRKFFAVFEKNEERAKFWRILLPPMCLNRYYLAEGVRLYSQANWKLIVGQMGPKLVEENVSHVVEYYISQSKADNHAVREAACHCIAELAMKLPKEFLAPYVCELLETLIICFDDDSWPVRDGACIASGNFVSAFPEVARPKIDKILPLFLMNLCDCIPSVRSGAAESIAKVLKAFDSGSCSNSVSGSVSVSGLNSDSNSNSISDFILEKLKEYLQKIDEQPENLNENEKFSGLQPGLTQFGVAKRIYANDDEFHTNQTMYSCGSLAPKMGRGGTAKDACDRKFRKPAVPWEFCDGGIYLLSELCVGCSQKFAPKLADFVPLVVKACQKRSYIQHVQLLETVCRQIPQIAKGLTKRFFKPHLDEILKEIFYAAKCGNELTEVAAADCLKNLAQFFGPSILRGRVEILDPKLLLDLDRILPPM